MRVSASLLLLKVCEVGRARAPEFVKAIILRRSPDLKGSIFRAFEAFVSKHWSDTLADYVFGLDSLETRGAYTSVGTYAHSELVLLVNRLSAETETEENALVNAFGMFLFAHLVAQNPSSIAGFGSCLDLLSNIESVIHRDVRNLNPDAEFPIISVLERDGDQRLVLQYDSARPMAVLAEGLIVGALNYFGVAEMYRLNTKFRAPDNTRAIFEIEINDHEE